MRRDGGQRDLEEGGEGGGGRGAGREDTALTILPMRADRGHSDPEEGRGPALAVGQRVLPGLAALLARDEVAAGLEQQEAVRAAPAAGRGAGGGRQGDGGHVALAGVALGHGAVVVVPLAWNQGDTTPTTASTTTTTDDDDDKNNRSKFYGAVTRVSTLCRTRSTTMYT